MVDDHPLVREGLRGVLEGYEHVHIVAEAADGYEAVKLASKTASGCGHHGRQHADPGRH